MNLHCFTTEKFRRLRAFRTLAVLASGVCLLGVVVAGCGGSSSGSTGSSGTTEATGEDQAASSKQVEAAKKFVADNVAAPKSIGPTEPVQKTPPSGKEIVYLDCGIPVCKTIGEGASEAGAALGWNVKELPMGALPAQITKGFNEAVQLEPDAVMSAGIPSVLFKSQLAQLESAEIPFVSLDVTEPANKGIVAVVEGRKHYEKRGHWMANWVTADSDGHANVLYFNVTEYPVDPVQRDAMREELKNICPECAFETVEVSVTTVGNELPSMIVSALQRKPEVNYVAFSFGDMTLGVVQALQAAGLNEQVKLISTAPGSTNFENIRNETDEEVNVAEPNLASGGLAIDALARYFNGEKLDQKAYEVLPLQYITRENIEEQSEPYVGIVNWLPEFEERWKVK